jgi:hypothetical protein
VVAGGGCLRLSGSNSGFDGRVVIEHGELRLESAAAIDAGAAIVFGGTSAAKGLTLAAVDVVVGRLGLSGDERIDLGTNSLTVAAGVSPERLVAALIDGRGDGSWRGATGIVSSSVVSDLAAGRPRAIGWLVTDNGGIRCTAAAPGDTNLDGLVDILDASNLVAGGAYDSGRPSDWNQGDFGYDGRVDILDIAEFTGTGLFDAGGYRESPVAAVPEPASSLPVVAVALAVGHVAPGRVRRATRAAGEARRS